MTKLVSLRKRLVWYVVVTTLILTLISGVGVYFGTTHEADEIFDAGLVQTARILDGLLTRQSIESNMEKLNAALARAAMLDNAGKTGTEIRYDEGHGYEKKVFFIIQDADGAALLKSHFAPEFDLARLSKGFANIDSAGKDWVTFKLRATHDKLWIIVGERTDIRNEITESISNALILPIIIILPLILFCLWHLVGQALRPLEKVVGQVRRQNIKRLRTIEVDRLPEEIEPLLTALNQMVERLNEGYDRERQFISDASHELRNPLAALLVNIENAIEENSDANLDESLCGMKLSTSRLSHLVSQLLLISHSENPLVRDNFGEVDLGDLCQQVAGLLESAARARNQDIQLVLANGHCIVNGSSSLLSSLISNLVNNAIQYCAEGSEIRLGCRVDKGDIILTIDDSGEGLSEEMQSRVIRRFYRAGNVNPSGAGLGLSIVQSIADVHSASMGLDHSDMGGLSVAIRFKPSTG